VPEFVKTIIAELASNRHKKSPESVAAVPRHNNYIHGGPKKVAPQSRDHNSLKSCSGIFKVWWGC